MAKTLKPLETAKNSLKRRLRFAAGVGGVLFLTLCPGTGAGTQLNPARVFLTEGAYNVYQVTPVNRKRGLLYGYEERI